MKKDDQIRMVREGSTENQTNEHGITAFDSAETKTLRRNGMKDPNNEELKAESPGISGASSDACRGTSLNSSPGTVGKPEHTRNVTPNESVGNNKCLNLSELRLTQDYESAAPVRKVITTIPIRTPSKQTFFRSHPEWSFLAMVLVPEDTTDTYVVAAKLHQLVGSEATGKALYPCITRAGDIFLLPVKLPASDGSLDSWNMSRMPAVERAKNKWVKMVSNKDAGMYEVYEAAGNIPEPEWPSDMTLEDILNVAFRGRIIDSLDHPVLKRLRGEI